MIREKIAFGVFLVHCSRYETFCRSFYEWTAYNSRLYTYMAIAILTEIDTTRLLRLTSDLYSISRRLFTTSLLWSV
jgi:hypothetical protein